MTKKISELTPAAALLAAMEFEVNDAGLSKKLTGQQIADFIGTGAGFTALVKSADETINSDTILTDDVDLQFEAEANATYFVMVFMFFDSVSTADFKYAMTLPGASSGTRLNQLFRNETAQSVQDIEIADSIDTNGAEQTIGFYGRFTMTGTPGTVAFQWAQQISNAGDTTLFKGSVLIFGKI